MPEEEMLVSETIERQPDKPPADDDAPMKLTLVRKKVEVEIDDENGNTVKYLLREMTGAVRDIWMNKTQTKMKTNAEGRSVGIRDFTGLHASLIASCLFQIDGKPVSEAVIQAFPSSTQNALFKRAQKMNGLDDEGEKAAKKD